MNLQEEFFSFTPIGVRESSKYSSMLHECAKVLEKVLGNKLGESLTFSTVKTRLFPSIVQKDSSDFISLNVSPSMMEGCPFNPTFKCFLFTSQMTSLPRTRKFTLKGTRSCNITKQINSHPDTCYWYYSSSKKVNFVKTASLGRLRLVLIDQLVFWSTKQHPSCLKR